MEFSRHGDLHYNLIILKALIRVKLFRKCTLIQSEAGGFYYIEEYATGHSYWLSTIKYTSQEAAKKIVDAAAWGCQGFSIMNNKYFLVAKAFPFWKIHSGQHKQVSINCDEAKDYYSIEHNRRIGQQ